MAEYTFKIADQDWEFEEIHRLNYRTFVEEIPQHERNAEHRLVDKFHEENTYLIAVKGKVLAGMMAIRTNRPFSLDTKMEDLDSYLPPGRDLAEIRLLAIDPEHRNRRILKGLLALLYNYSVEEGIDMGVISGTVRQKKLYSRMGFTPFGPLVGSGTALYQPMYVTVETFKQYLPQDEGKKSEKEIPEVTNLLPGPVQVNETVQKTFGDEPVSHRDPNFMQNLHNTRDMLCELTGANEVEIMQGGGTLANDVVALQIAALRSPGIVLVSGEFGERLADHARRAGLDFKRVEKPWGTPISRENIEKALAEVENPAWLWAVHCESSTGVLNKLDVLKPICAEHDLKLCLDCTSTIGTMDVQLGDVYLATGSSGKGLISYPGLALVFSREKALPPLENVPRCLDLGYYMEKDGMPFTLSSNLVLALQASLRNKAWPERFQDIRHQMAEARALCEKHGLETLAPAECSSPAIITIVLPENCDSVELGEKLEERGYLLSFHSEYLVRRNWIQICLMGDSVDANFERLIPLIANPEKMDDED